jgi:hypothetical protein
MPTESEMMHVAANNTKTNFRPAVLMLRSGCTSPLPATAVSRRFHRLLRFSLVK